MGFAPRRLRGAPAAAVQDQGAIVPAPHASALEEELGRCAIEARQQQEVAARDDAAKHQQIVEWSAAHPAQNPELFDETFRVEPMLAPGPGGPDGRVFGITWPIPASSFAQYVLQRVPKNVLKGLRDDWCRRHEMVFHGDQPSVPSRVGFEHVCACRVARMCLCSDDGRVLNAFVGAVTSTLRRAAPKGSSLRTRLRLGVIVVAVLPDEGEQHFSTWLT